MVDENVSCNCSKALDYRSIQSESSVRPGFVQSLSTCSVHFNLIGFGSLSRAILSKYVAFRLALKPCESNFSTIFLKSEAKAIKAAWSFIVGL